MMTSAHRIRAWLSELRRRGVFHVTGLYAVGAWAAVQIVDAISGPFPLPEAALRLIWFAALLGFPVALIFGWRYDITKSGIVRTHRRLSHGEDVPIGRSDYCVIGGLALVMAGIVAMTTVGVLDAIEDARLRATLGPEFVEIQENSIAVLPFAVCEGDERDEALAEGLATEVINRLASQRLMRVIARASAFTIAGFDIPFLEMSQRLGVTHLLTGTVCREGGDLVVSVELLDEKGFVVWSETLRQDVGQSGKVRTTLASLVVEGVAGALGHRITLARAVPVNPKAYEHFLIGEQFMEAGDEDKAKQEYQKALEIQPDYPEAVMALGRVAAEGDTTIDWLENNRAYLERAVAMARQQVDAGGADFQAHLTLGKVLYYLGRTDQELAWRKARELGDEGAAKLKVRAKDRLTESEQHLRKALASNPTNIDTYRWLVNSLDWQGIERGGEALEIMESALDTEPFNMFFSMQVANRLAARGRYREGIELLERFERLPETPVCAYWAQLEIMNNRGATADHFEKLVGLLRERPELFGSVGTHLCWQVNLQSYLWALPGNLEALGMPEEAERWYERVQQLPDPGGLVRTHFRRWASADYLHAIGRTDEAIALLLPEEMSDEEILDGWFVEVGARIGGIGMTGDYERAIRLQESLHKVQHRAFWEERQAWGDIGLANLYLRVGREEDARREMEAAAKELEEQIEAGLRHPGIFMQLAGVYMALERDQEALEMAEKHVAYGGWGPANGFDAPPDDDRSARIVDRARANLEQEVQRIRAITARNDIDALLAAVPSKPEEETAKLEDPG